MSGRVADASDPPRPRRRGRDPSARHAWAAANASVSTQPTARSWLHHVSGDRVGHVVDRPG
eukprot:3737360-Prymnesium_polylepis.1